MTALALAIAGCEHTFEFDRPTDAGEDRSMSVGPTRCTEDAECGLPSLHCEVGSGECVACLLDRHCNQLGLPRCDPVLRRCVACEVTEDCATGFACIDLVHTCVRTCTSGADCGAPERECDLARGVCEGCDRLSECAGTPSTPVCDAHAHRCVECVADGDCAAPTPHCDTAIARCVECFDSTQCTAATSLCDPIEHVCVTSG